MEFPNVPAGLTAEGPFLPWKERLDTFGRLIGDWMVEGEWYTEGAPTRTGRGRWQFWWILGGRGVQDLLYAEGAPEDQWGTTLRCYDPYRDCWHVSWMQPGGGEFVHLVGRAEADRIVQEGQGADRDRVERWSFTDIHKDSFLWTGEVSRDQGRTWYLEQKLIALRNP